MYNSRQIGISDLKSLPSLEQEPKDETNSSDVHAKSLRIQYNTRDQFKKAAKLYGLMDDFKVSQFK